MDKRNQDPLELLRKMKREHVCEDPKECQVCELCYQVEYELAH